MTDSFTQLDVALPAFRCTRPELTELLEDFVVRVAGGETSRVHMRLRISAPNWEAQFDSVEAFRSARNIPAVLNGFSFCAVTFRDEHRGLAISGPRWYGSNAMLAASSDIEWCRSAIERARRFCAQHSRPYGAIQLNAWSLLLVAVAMLVIVVPVLSPLGLDSLKSGFSTGAAILGVLAIAAQSPKLFPSVTIRNA